MMAQALGFPAGVPGFRLLPNVAQFLWAFREQTIRCKIAGSTSVFVSILINNKWI